MVTDVLKDPSGFSFRIRILVGLLNYCSRCNTTTALKLSGCISRWAMNLSREYYVADTQENRCSSTESFLLKFLYYTTLFHLHWHYTYKMYVCVLQCRNLYIFTRSVAVYIHFSCSFQTLLSCSNTDSLLTVMSKRTATFFQLQCGDNNTNFPLQYDGANCTPVYIPI